MVHVHRGKEHWLAAVANRLIARPRPLVRTRHIALAVRPHAANRWLYRRATALVVTVTESIRGQLIASGLVDGDRVVALPGGADTERYRPLPRDPEMHARLGGRPGHPLVGMVAGLRVMKGHAIVVEAAARLAARGIRPHFAFVGRGRVENDGSRHDRASRPRRHSSRSSASSTICPRPSPRSTSRSTCRSSPTGCRAWSSSTSPRGARSSPRAWASCPKCWPTASTRRSCRRATRRRSPRHWRLSCPTPPGGERLGEAGRRLIGERYSGARVAAALESRYARLVTAAAA